MRILFLFIIILFISACSSMPKAKPSKEQSTQTKILHNQFTAIDAKDEYKKLQNLRNKE